MSEPKLTVPQAAVRDVRDKNLLVSAAAGSGKTAVLVERIKKIIIEEKHSIDEMLVLTFTNAAASEMRERIGKTLEAILESDAYADEAEKKHILEQYTLVHHAQITTIDSFCMWLVKNYFEMADIEPGFRIADEGEMKLLKRDVAESVLEEFYSDASESFIGLADKYASSKEDETLTDMVISFYEKSLSFPNPINWMKEMQKGAAVPQKEDWNYEIKIGEDIPWFRGIRQLIEEKIEYMISLCEKGAAISGEYNLPGFVSNYEKIIDMLKELMFSNSYDDLRERILSLKYPTFSKKGLDPELTAAAYTFREKLTKITKEIKDDFFEQDFDQIVSDTKAINETAKALVSLSLSMYEQMNIKKKKLNMYGFDDIEHKALNILVDENGNPTDVALELREKYYEIMTDEYQDSNFLQEYILEAISNGHNRFMVGDVKQSIYGFRQGKPELFIGKYKEYKGFAPDIESVPADSSVRINLATNFRSRTEVLNSVNDVFFDTMKASIGGVEYDDEAKLNPKPDNCEVDSKYKTEVIVADTALLDTVDFVNSKEELEGLIIAERIKKLHQEEGFNYKDIVILMRSTAWGENVRKIMDAQGIPSHMVSRAGYFDNYEVQLVLAILKVIDNPYQDIPMAAVMASVVGGFLDEELALIRKSSEERYLFGSVKKYIEVGSDETLKKKASDFVQRILDYREKMLHNSVSEMIRLIIDDGVLINYFSATPSGSVRKANLDALLEKAISFEKTSYRGVFSFVRYIDALRKYEVDFGEADLADENDDLVRIMTIHKSKGLQFPVVFVSGCGRGFNEQDLKAKTVVDDRLGMGFEIIDSKRHFKRKTLFRRFVTEKLKRDAIGEEERVLYVAMTRPESKLIITGTSKEKVLNDYRASADSLSRGIPLCTGELSETSCYLDLVFPSAASNSSDFTVMELSESDLAAMNFGIDVKACMDVDALMKAASDCDKNIYSQIDERLKYAYPYVKDTTLKMKRSVSELKHEEMVILEDDQGNFQKLPTDSGSKANKGALYGTAMHRFMELIDYDSYFKNPGAAEISRQLDFYHECGKLDDDTYELIDKTKVLAFMENALSKNLAKAYSEGRLFRERPFVMALPAREAYKFSEYQTESEEKVLVQGIIDLYYIDDNGITVIDYKTDAISSDEALIERYKKQLYLYADALARGTGLPVYKILMYSFRLGRYVEVN